MRGLTLMHTVDGTSADLPSRVARYAWPKPPSPSSRSMRYRRPVSGLSIAWPDTSSRCPRAIGTLIDRVVRVVAVEGWRAMRGKLYQAAMRARYFGPRADSGTPATMKLVPLHWKSSPQACQVDRPVDNAIAPTGRWPAQMASSAECLFR